MSPLTFEDRTELAVSQASADIYSAGIPITDDCPFIQQALDDWALPNDPVDRQRLAGALSARDLRRHVQPGRSTDSDGGGNPTGS